MLPTDEFPGWMNADWPVPVHIRAGTSTRIGGISKAPHDSLNLGAHVGDTLQAVASNRHRLAEALQLPAEPVWLQQVHGHRVTAAHEHDNRVADAAWTDRPGIVCAVLTADCLPLLLCDRAGTRVSIIHVGWRGLVAGIIQETLSFMPPADTLLAWLGPAIGPDAFEVGGDVYHASLKLTPAARDAFAQGKPGHWCMNLPALAQQVLLEHGVTECFHSGLCTYRDKQKFYSYRRDGVTGRMASLIWIDADQL